MHTLKYGLEKPALIWVLIAILYTTVFWTVLSKVPVGPEEQASFEIVKSFSESSFPPKIQLVRELPDWGHVAFYALMGRFFLAVGGDPIKLRAVGLVLVLFALLTFVRLGYRFTYRNRLNPLWISLALILLAANPYLWSAAFHIDYVGPLLLFLLLAMILFEQDQLGWSALVTGAAVLMDWRALILAVAFLLSRTGRESSRVLRAERMIAYAFPFVMAALPLIAWQGIVPQGEARDWWHQVREHVSLFRPDGLFYCMALLPIYGLYFAWAWGIKARTRALMMGAIWAGLLIPLYFIFPVRFDAWSALKGVSEAPLGFLDQGALLIAGPYKNLLLFVPWLVGAFLFMQLLLMDVLDRSRWLRYFVVLFFVIQPALVAVGGVGDRDFLIVLPVILLLSLSEALVGEEGKLA